MIYYELWRNGATQLCHLGEENMRSNVHFPDQLFSLSCVTVITIIKISQILIIITCKLNFSINNVYWCKLSVFHYHHLLASGFTLVVNFKCGFLHCP